MTRRRRPACENWTGGGQRGEARRVSCTEPACLPSLSLFLVWCVCVPPPAPGSAGPSRERALALAAALCSPPGYSFSGPARWVARSQHRACAWPALARVAMVWTPWWWDCGDASFAESELPCGAATPGSPWARAGRAPALWRLCAAGAAAVAGAALVFVALPQPPRQQERPAGRGRVTVPSWTLRGDAGERKARAECVAASLLPPPPHPAAAAAAAAPDTATRLQSCRACVGWSVDAPFQARLLTRPGRLVRGDREGALNVAVLLTVCAVLSSDGAGGTGGVAAERPHLVRLPCAEEQRGREVGVVGAHYTARGEARARSVGGRSLTHTEVL